MFVFVEIKYQLLRNKGRALLLAFSAAFLLSCLVFYLGNIHSVENAYENVAESLPVTATVINRNGSRRDQLSIDPKHYEALTSYPVHDVLCTSMAEGVIDADVQAQSAEGFAGSDTSITGTNSIEVLSTDFLENVEFAAGWDDSFLAGSEPVCAVSRSYAAKHGLSLQDHISLLLYKTSFSTLGPVYKPLGKAELTVIGLFGGPVDAGGGPSMLLPVEWLHKRAGQSEDVDFSYSSLKVTLDDPRQLNDFKETMEKSGFLTLMENPMDKTTGDCLAVEDELFIKTAQELSESLNTYKRFFLPFCILIVSLVTLITFLSLRNSRRDLAIASSLGRDKFQNALSQFLAILTTDVIGCAAAFPILCVFTGVPPLQILSIAGIFLVCAAVGVILALVMLLRFDALALLTKVD